MWQHKAGAGGGMLDGRDTASVFPSEAREANKKQMEELKKAIGLDSSKFVAETEASTSDREAPKEANSAPWRPLAAILAENEAKKQEAFQEVWKTMKQGKNRPLDEDDLAFVNSLVESEEAKERGVREAEKSELEMYQQAVRLAAEKRQQSEQPADAKEQQSTEPQISRQLISSRQSKPMVKVKQKAQQQKLGANQGPAPKRQRLEEETPAVTAASDLTGLMEGYLTDSDSDR